MFISRPLEYYFTGAYGYFPFRRFAVLQPITPILVTTSLLWTAWDPTYASFRKAQLQGREVRVQGKRAYIVSSQTPTCVNLSLPF